MLGPHCSVSFIFSVPSLSSSTQSGRSSRSVAFPQLIRQLVIITTVSSNNCVDEPRLGPTRISLRVIWSLILLDTLIERWCNNFDPFITIIQETIQNLRIMLQKYFIISKTQITFQHKFAIFGIILIRSYPNYSDRPEFFRSIRTFPIRSEVSSDSQLGARR